MRISTKLYKRIFNASLITILSCLMLTACSGEDGKDGIAGAKGENGIDGKDGKDAKEVNVDSLAKVLREEITGTLWDSLYAEPYVDTVYKILFDNAYGTSWMDSTRQALIDSLNQANYDSLYKKLYDSVYTDIYSKNAIRTLDAFVWTSKENIYGAFANQYPLMYKNFAASDGTEYPMPLSVMVRNTCERGNANVPCRWKKVLLKSWVEGFSDTASVTGIVNPDTSVVLAPSFKFNNKALLALTAPQSVQFQIRVYALENDQEILFYSSSKATKIYPMQINGGELVGIANPHFWEAVWVTPGMDSISTILNELKGELPDSTVKIYQKYADDESVPYSSRRVAKAIFNVLHKRGIHYVQNNGAGTTAQKINYPIEVLRSRDGLCIETTMLFASILEALGMQALIIEIPGHAFVGWRVEKDSKILDFMETTMLGNPDATADQANLSAQLKYADEVEDGHFDSGESRVIDISKAREFGVLPNDIP
ncbi:hypothetical protein [Fibrobacter sp. UWB10]|uniref:hypothetical protein n=1 Tax=Fibrobacter sp. UWB10 TaxID=1896201 RepID=UPI00240352EB|nr:hypothetical protein [Fibrobacter sp. UWB10]SMP43542.1 hypothetical protein SAMN05720465_0919 [Fibrobacter sp. UWB10]